MTGREIQASRDSAKVRWAGIDRRIEAWLALVVMGLSLLYLLTDHSRAPVFWHYSERLLVAIGAYALFYLLFLISYSWPCPSVVVRLRSYSVLVGFWCVLGILGSEVFLGLIDKRPNVVETRLRGYEPDPELGYVYQPNFEQELVFFESATRWRTNSLGIRADREYGTKPDGIVRILALGDSFTVAADSALEAAWPSVLEGKLNAQARAGVTFEVVNAGHAAYGTMQQARWLALFGDQLDLDGVIVAMTPNDIADNGAEPPGNLTAIDGYLARGTSTDDDRRSWEHHQRWYSLPGQVARSRLWERIVQLQRHVRRPREAYRLVLSEEGRRLHELTESYLAQIQEWSAARGIEFSLMLITFREQLGEMASGYDPEVFGQRWVRFAAQHGIPVVDTFQAVRSHPDPATLFWRWDDHYSSAGQSLAGNAAFDLIAGNSLHE